MFESQRTNGFKGDVQKGQTAVDDDGWTRLDLFRDLLPSILQTKKHVITKENEKEDYVPFNVNKALSFYLDCILPANNMNRFPAADHLLQYHYLINTIRGYKRPFQKWHKREKSEALSEALDAVKEYYDYSNEKAREALSILSHDQIDEIKYITRKGGLQNDKHKQFDRGDTT